jgi:hypothetical protein
MNEKLNIIEARKMPSYTEFKVLYDCGHYDKRTIKKLPNGFFEWSDKSQEWLCESILMAKFIPIQKTVNTTEAFKSLDENKEIESVCTHNRYKKENRKLLLVVEGFGFEECESISSEEILDDWIIIEQ